MKVLFKEINCLFGAYEQAIISPLKGEGLQKIEKIEGAWLAVEDGKVADFGSMDNFPGISDWSGLDVIDMAGSNIYPAFCDSHTHLVYSHTREEEFSMRLRGMSYQEIASRGGGILNSAGRMKAADENVLFEAALARANEMIALGTGSLEIKSGYGLDTASELKMLRVIKRLKETLPIPVKATFLGAHAVPTNLNKEKYIDLLLHEMLPEVAAQNLADYCDVFCEQGYFSAEDTRKILDKAATLGLRGKVHAEQLSDSGGVLAGIESGAISVDHLEFLSPGGIQALKNSNTIPTLLPGAQFFLGLKNPPVAEMLAAELPIALSSDHNPGSCPSFNMALMVSLACILYRMSPESAFNAATQNSACAIELGNETGTLCRGKRANFFTTGGNIQPAHLPYFFGNPIIRETYINGLKFS
jgi:imidazolonepropionase